MSTTPVAVLAIVTAASLFRFFSVHCGLVSCGLLISDCAPDPGDVDVESGGGGFFHLAEIADFYEVMQERRRMTPEAHSGPRQWSSLLQCRLLHAQHGNGLHTVFDDMQARLAKLETPPRLKAMG